MILKSILPALALSLFASGLLAQNRAKPTPRPDQGAAPAAERLQLNPDIRLATPPAANPFGFAEPVYQPMAPLQLKKDAAPGVQIFRDQDGQAIAWKGRTAASVAPTADFASALAYAVSVAPEGLRQPALELVATRRHADESGAVHTRIEQVWQGVPVYGAELIAHARNGRFDLLNGRYYPTPDLTDAVPDILPETAIQTVKNAIGLDHVKSEWSAMDLQMIGGGEPFEARLVVYHIDGQKDRERLAWPVQARPNLMRRALYFIDAENGEILHHFDHTCNISGHCTHREGEFSAPVSTGGVRHHDGEIAGPVTGFGTDLLGVNREFGVWQVNANQYVMEDAGQDMFNPASQMPNDPIGVIVTLDALNTSPEVQQSFDYTLVTSTSSTFNNTKAVSTHWNSIKSYEYFKTKFGRQSIDGEGGNIIAFFNVTEANGDGMDNAFWNGAAMWYGNGDQFFKPLARALDVGGHEMSHGVVEKTANLEYQGESGALNESFADIFGAMIDNNDWKIGEDVMNPGIAPNNCLRDLENPANGDTPGGGNNFGGNFWQPAHVNQKYTGSLDNAGVHKNSGIPNHAYYLFATSAGVGKDKAEQVYYKALRDYLTKSSKFVDCRIAVIQAATDLYGASVANAAASAFDQVGITGSAPSGNYLGQLSANPGEDFVLCVADDYSSVDLAIGNGTVLGSVYNSVDIQSRPSITDDGSQAVFVNEDNHIMYVDFAYSPTEITPTVNQLSQAPEWRSAAISKDGRYVAALTDFLDKNIYVFDLVTGTSNVYSIYNPTYSQEAQTTGEAAYADVLEFDYSGEYIMYDAYNEVTNSAGQDLSYWDIGFLRFRENGTWTNGASAPISKLFSGLPEKVNIGDPTFAKNSPFIIAFDLYDGLENANYVLGANVETGDNDLIASDVGDYSWPNYDRLDQYVIFHSPSFFGDDIYYQQLNANKIQGTGNPGLFIESHRWGVWYANGDRSLMVNAGEITQSGAGLTISPNPATDYVNLRMEIAQSFSNARVDIVDQWGRIVRTHSVNLQAGYNTAQLLIGELPAGIYTVRLAAGAQLAAQRLVKM